MISSLALVLPIVAAALSRAQDPTGTNHIVTVGGPGGLIFDPPNLFAPPGDNITFVFHEKNHSATQSSFASPCSPMEGGFDSGFLPSPPDAATNPQFIVTVNNSDTIWVYCKQPGPPAHCTSGMVFAANAVSTASEGNTFEAFQAQAIALGGGNASTLASAPPTSSTASAPPASSTTSASSAGTSPPAPNTTPAPAAATHRIVVGGDAGLVYTPNTVDAAIGDTVVFEFHAKNHTVTQSSFNQPCLSLEKATGGTQFGFDSNFMPVAPNATTNPEFAYVVNVTTPIWFHCKQPGPPAHCQSGMVGAINPPTTGANTFPAFQQLAQHSSSAPNSTTGSGSSGGNGTASGGSGAAPPKNGAGGTAMSAGLSVGMLGAVFVAML